jgi:uncharacterized membrane protein YraQ (UPF0718 family)
MTLLDHAPRTRVGVVAWAVVAAAAWAGAYWLNEHLWDWLLYGAAGLSPDNRWAEALHFFLYDVSKIALLLTGVIFVVAVLRTFVSIERTRAVLGGKRQGVGNVLAAGLGTVTPFCSCSAVPVFIGFVGAGVPLGVTFSFLIASPLVNEIAVVLLWTAFGPKVALAYMGAGLLIAIVAGWVIGKAKLERWVEPFVLKATLPMAPGITPRKPTTQQRLSIGAQEVKTIVGKAWPYLLVGVGLGALIHGWVPADLVARIAGPDNPLGVPMAVLLGIPLYSNAAGALPLVEALGAKGVPIGTLLAFMMSVVALSLPEMVLLKRVLKLPLIGIFIGVVATGIIAVGYLFNALFT